jgi:hypothetical protein
MKAKHSDEIIIIDAPVLNFPAPVFRSGVIYSINLDNGAVITSPESFEAISIAKIQGGARTQRVPTHPTPPVPA